jgi:hypothetical protein
MFNVLGALIFFMGIKNQELELSRSVMTLNIDSGNMEDAINFILCISLSSSGHLQEPLTKGSRI